LFVP